MPLHNLCASAVASANYCGCPGKGRLALGQEGCNATVSGDTGGWEQAFCMCLQILKGLKLGLAHWRADKLLEQQTRGGFKRESFASASVITESAPKMDALHVSTPRESLGLLPLLEALQHRQVVPPQGPFKLLPLLWDWEHRRFCAFPLKKKGRVSISYSSPAFSSISLVSKPEVLGTASSWCRTSRLGRPVWGL